LLTVVDVRDQEFNARAGKEGIRGDEVPHKLEKHLKQHLIAKLPVNLECRIHKVV